MDRMTTCFFTGHRDIPYGRRAELEQQVRECIRALASRGYKQFIAGGAVGFDRMCENAVLELRQELGIKLYLVLPCENQDEKFSPAEKKAYRDNRALADGVFVLYPEYRKDCMLERNRRMANNSSLCVAFCTRRTGGSAYTVGYCRSRGIDVINLAEDI